MAGAAGRVLITRRSRGLARCRAGPGLGSRSRGRVRRPLVHRRAPGAPGLPDEPSSPWCTGAPAAPDALVPGVRQADHDPHQSRAARAQSSTRAGCVFSQSSGRVWCEGWLVCITGNAGICLAAVGGWMTPPRARAACLELAEGACLAIGTAVAAGTAQLG